MNMKLNAIQPNMSEPTQVLRCSCSKSSIIPSLPLACTICSKAANQSDDEEKFDNCSGSKKSKFVLKVQLEGESS